MSDLRFEWDEAKAAENLEKHTTVFADENARLIADPDHSEDEDRFVLLGLGFSVRLLVVVHCYRSDDDMIRIISARKATRPETDYYSKVQQ